MKYAHRNSELLVVVYLVVQGLFLDAAFSSENALRVNLAAGTEREKQAQQQLERLVSTYDVDRWIYTKDILIDDEQPIPHSHPILTLNSRYIDDDHTQLSTFLHEQFHWYAIDREEDVLQAIDELRKEFPKVPTDRTGAKSEFSTYLHLVVCDLEYQAISIVLGKQAAENVLNGFRHYSWVYAQVLSNPRVREITEEFGLVAT